jgi:hypothetical protein
MPILYRFFMRCRILEIFRKYVVGILGKGYQETSPRKPRRSPFGYADYTPAPNTAQVMSFFEEYGLVKIDH